MAVPAEGVGPAHLADRPAADHLHHRGLDRREADLRRAGSRRAGGLRPEVAPTRRCGRAPRLARALARQDVAVVQRSRVLLDPRAAHSSMPAGEVTPGRVHAGSDDVQVGHTVDILDVALDVVAAHASGICCCNTDSPSDCAVEGTSGTSHILKAPLLISQIVVTNFVKAVL